MGLFGNIFGSKNEDKEKEKDERKIAWIELKTVNQLLEIVANSNSRPQVIFKHSTTCGISRMVLNMFTQSNNLSNGQMDFYFLDLHNYRDVSNEVANTFQVVHQSPQLLVIKNGTVIAHGSHGSITEINLEKYI